MTIGLDGLDLMEGLPDRMEEECGVFGIYGDQRAAELSYLGLYALQHRGQESAGIAVNDSNSIRQHKGMGLVSDVFDEDLLETMHGSAAIGHVRYSTTGGSNIANAQPLLIQCALGSVALAHNGNLTNSGVLRDSLIHSGALFQGSTDTEVIANLLARSRADSLVEALTDACSAIEGAFSLVVLAKDMIIGIRDPHGFRPLCLGQLGEAYILASESCAITSLGGTVIRDIEAGEMVVAGKEGLSFKQIWEPRHGFCVFEYIYFARPDSTIAQRNVHQVRYDLGRILAREHPVEADIVIPVPDSGISSALGYSEYSNIRYGTGLLKNRYVGRTFITPSQKQREKAVSIKHNAIASAVAGKRVIMVDDSIVRGTTSRKIVKALRDAGAKEVHLRVSSPPVTHSCFFGIDTPEREKLVAFDSNVEEIRQMVGADSLGYISMEGMLEAVGLPAHELCTGCFSGDYPIDVAACIEDGRCGCCGG